VPFLGSSFALTFHGTGVEWITVRSAVTVLSLRMAVAIYVTGMSTPGVRSSVTAERAGAREAAVVLVPTSPTPSRSAHKDPRR
jgi:hypothetical protein